MRSFCVLTGADYFLLDDEFFRPVPERFRNFGKVTQSDLARLYWIRFALRSGSDRVYWIDSDVLMWNPQEFTLRLPVAGAVVCCAESWWTRRPKFPIVDFRVNNAIIGFCDAAAVDALINHSEEILDRYVGREQESWKAVIGTDIFSMGDFPIRRIVQRSSGCFSPDSMHEIARGDFGHVLRLGLAQGTTLQAANLCSSMQPDEDTMERAIDVLTDNSALTIGAWKWIWPLYRGALHVVRWADKIRHSITKF